MTDDRKLTDDEIDTIQREWIAQGMSGPLSFARAVERAILSRTPAPSEPVAPSQAVSDAYDKIDRYLRNNLDDADYAAYSEALECVFAGAVAAPSGVPGNMADVLDALNVFNKAGAGEEPWTEDDFIKVKALPEFIESVLRAWGPSRFAAAPSGVPADTPKGASGDE